MIGGLIGLIVGMLGGLAGTYVMARLRAQTARGLAEEILADAHREAETIRKEADLQSKEETLRRREALDAEVEETRKDLREQERRLEKRADLLDQKLELINKKEREFEIVQRYLAEQQEELQPPRRRRSSRSWPSSATRSTGSPSSRPRRPATCSCSALEDELRHEVGGLILKHEQRLRETCQQKAREILATAIQRYAAAHTAETTVSTVDIPTDDMKGRIIGREGRNIRAFEKATGVDVIVDDTPGIVIVTGFDNIRREIAKLSLEKLIQDGRIHPTRIEEIVKETQEEMEQHIRQLGQAAAQEANVAGPAREAARLPRPAQVPHQLLAERPAALDRGRLPDRPDGRGDRPRRRPRPPLRAAARHRQGGRPRDGGGPPRHRRRADQALRRAQGGRPRRARPPRRPPARDARTPSSSPPPTPSAPAVPAPAARPWRSTSGGSRSWRPWPAASPASSRPTRSRPAARSA